MTSDAQLSHETLQKIMATVDIPACPKTVMEAMAEAQKDEPDLRTLSARISADAGMSAAALRLANSPLFARRTPVTSVRQAVEQLGTQNVVCIIVGSALKSSVSGLPASWIESFWRRNQQVAVAAAMIARRQYGVSRDAAYTYTLFHDAAIPIMLKRFPDYLKVIESGRQAGLSVAEAENQFFPCTHPIVGSLLVRNWGLQSTQGLAIRFHHDPEAYTLPESSLPGTSLNLIAITQVAEFIVADLLGDHNQFEVTPAMFDAAVEHLGIAPDELDDLTALITQSLDETG